MLDSAQPCTVATTPQPLTGVKPWRPALALSSKRRLTEHRRSVGGACAACAAIIPRNLSPMSDVSPAIIPDAGEPAKDPLASSEDGVGKSKEEEGSFFGGWAIPDLGKVIGEIVDGTDGKYDASGKAIDGSASGADEDGADGDVDDDDGDAGIHGEDLQLKAAELADVASKELASASRAAQVMIGQGAQDLGKGWGKLNHFLDDMLAPQQKKASEDGGGEEDGDDDAEDLAEDEDVQVRFHSLFPDIEESSDVVDHYRCVLLQKYRCFLNPDTPEMSVALSGRLFVCTTHLAMYVFNDHGAFNGAKFFISIPFADVSRVQKGAKSMMRVLTSSQTSYIFGQFESETHFGGALSLVEHMIEAKVATPEQIREEALKADSSPGMQT